MTGEMGTTLAGLTATVERQQQQATAMREQLESVQVTERSAEGAVEVVLDHGGRLIDLVLTDKCRRLPPAELAGAVMRCVTAASSRLPDRLAEAMRAVSPADHQLVEAVAGHYARMFGPPEEPLRQPPPPDDDGFAVLRKATDWRGDR